MDAINVANLTVKYQTPSSQQAKTALADVSLKIKRGQWVAIVGHNGSGKSTLAKTLDGLIEPEAGKITVMTIALNKTNVYQVRDQIGMVFQNPENQFVGATVEGDVAFGLENWAVPTTQMHQRVKAALQQVKMEAFAKRQPNKLSGGQKQRVAIAGVLALMPAVVIFDEATSMLDPEGKQQVIELMKWLHDEKKLTVLSITHDIDEATLADRVVVLDDGKIVADDTPEKIFADEMLVEKSGLELPFAQQLARNLASHPGLVEANYYTNESLLAELATKLGGGAHEK